MKTQKKYLLALCAVFALLVGTFDASALAYMNTGSTTFQTTAPADSRSNLWNLTVPWVNGTASATPIAPRWMVCPKHLNSTNGTTFTFTEWVAGVPQTLTRTQALTVTKTGTDLRLVKITDASPAFANFATINRRTNIFNEPLLVFGRGRPRGSVITQAGWPSSGWATATSGNQLRWGSGVAEFTNTYANIGPIVGWGFWPGSIAATNADFCMFLTLDSGGGVYVQHPTCGWQLVGPMQGNWGNYRLTATGTTKNGAITNYGGLFYSDGTAGTPGDYGGCSVLDLSQVIAWIESQTGPLPTCP